jgi:hypothetical protein
MPSREELVAQIELQQHRDGLDGAASGLLTQQTAVLDELGAWVKRHAALATYVRRFPGLPRLEKAAEHAGQIVDLARRLESALEIARVEALNARDKTQKEINALPRP